MTEQPAEQPPAEFDVLAALDFTMECDLVHPDGPCHKEARYVATIHNCNVPEGTRLIVCGSYVVNVVETDYSNTCCARCKKSFSSMLDRAWDIQPLGSLK